MFSFIHLSSQNFGDQPLKIQIEQKFYLSGQFWISDLFA